MLALLLLAVVWASAPAPTLVLTDGRTGVPVARLPISGTVTMRYVHSFIHQPAAEVFAAEPSGLRLVRLASPSEAVLEYYARPEPIRPAGEVFAIDIADEPARPLTALASAVGRRTVESGGRAIALHDLVPHGTPVRFSVEMRPRLVNLLER